jgi:hypothetical protein
MTKAEFNKVWIYLKGCFPEMVETTELNFEAYFDVLSDIEYGVAIDGARRFARESGAKFFPSAPEFRRYVSPPLTPSEKAFDLAVRDHREREKVRKEILGEFLEERRLANEYLVRVHWNEDDPFRDDWTFLPEEEALKFDEAHRVSIPYLNAFLEKGDQTLAPSIRNALLNLAREWLYLRNVKGVLPE